MVSTYTRLDRREADAAAKSSQRAIHIVTRTEASFAKKRLEDLAANLPTATAPALRLRRQITTALGASRQ